IYAPVKQLIAAFSPDNESGFKRVVMIEDPRRGYALGFQTREFTVDRGRGPEPLLAVYLPTNNLYLGDIVIVERDRATFPDISVEDGIKIFLSGGGWSSRCWPSCSAARWSRCRRSCMRRRSRRRRRKPLPRTPAEKRTWSCRICRWSISTVSTAARC